MLPTALVEEAELFKVFSEKKRSCFYRKEALALMPALERLADSMCAADAYDPWAQRLLVLQQLCLRFRVTESLLEMAQVLRRHALPEAFLRLNEAAARRWEAKKVSRLLKRRDPYKVG